MLHYFELFLDFLRNKNGDLSVFWMSYIDMVTILLGLLRASREGNGIFMLHASAVCCLGALHMTKSIMPATLVFIMLRCLTFMKHI